MFAVRYIALAMLAIWVGGLLFVLAGGVSDLLLRRFDVLAYACGGAILAALLVMKFVGPPPHTFGLRAALVVAMLVITAVSARSDLFRAATMANTAIGLALLAWYARE
jgi:hypothetical protein